MIRKTAAVWAGKATGTISRISRRGGGTTLPGDVARMIDPKVLTKLAQDLTNGSIVITGTNGKTTTARLLTWLLEGAGHKVVANRAGANLIFGVTAAALDRAGADSKLRADWGVFEIDEASLPKAVEEIRPSSISSGTSSTATASSNRSPRRSREPSARCRPTAPRSSTPTTRAWPRSA
jgi:UDP-N-acetylmuramyl tripeptide synthase